ncbi:MAG TPA: tetratricopeptide repeat protein [Acidobacteriaceae bacterium]|nr:tetratricopeptide repeat protein [Acidobacteriaceae bacterium]
MVRVLGVLLAGLLTAGTCLIAQEASVLPRARQLEAANRLEDANQLLEEYARRNPGDAAVLIELGKVQMRQRLSDDAMRSFASALAIDPHSSAARDGEVKAAVASALADRNVGDNNGALSTLMRARKLVPDSLELLTDFGVQADAMQLYQDADKALAQAHAMAPNDSKALYALARVELDEQKMSDAEAHFRAYLKMRPDDASAHYGLGHLLRMLVRNDEAKAELERSIALKPRQTESYYELGEIALQMHEDKEAAAEFQKVLSSDPRHGGALTGMGVLAYRAKNYAEAEKYLSKAVQYAPDYVEAHQSYALTLARLGRKTDAARESSLATSLREQQEKLRHGYHLITQPEDSSR